MDGGLIPVGWFVRNPGSTHQLRLVVGSWIVPLLKQRFSTIPGGCLGFLSSTVSDV